MRTDVFGWFSGLEDKPQHDPGLNGICPVCAAQLNKPVKTISLMPETRNGKSYFFRCHKSCWDNIDDEEKNSIESSLIDEICGSI